MCDPLFPSSEICCKDNFRAVWYGVSNVGDIFDEIWNLSVIGEQFVKWEEDKAEHLAVGFSGTWGQLLYTFSALSARESKQKGECINQQQLERER